MSSSSSSTLFACGAPLASAARVTLTIPADVPCSSRPRSAARKPSARAYALSPASTSAVFASSAFRRQFFAGGRVRSSRPASQPVSTAVVAEVKEIGAAEFATEVLAADQPVLVDFYRTLCGPCRLMAPLMDWADGEYGSKIRVIKIEADNNSDLAKECGVSGLPAILIYQNGEQIAHHEGVFQKAKFKAFLEQHVPSLA